MGFQSYEEITTVFSPTICPECMAQTEKTNLSNDVVVFTLGETHQYHRPHFIQVYGEDKTYHATLHIGKKIVKLCKLKDIFDKER
jgi:hypothetical protein